MYYPNTHSKCKIIKIAKNGVNKQKEKKVC